jgi:hypothetical protein
MLEHRPLTRSDGLSRRAFLERAAVGGAAIAITGVPTAAAKRRRKRRGKTQIPLPSPHEVRQEFTRMVEFGPRLTASESHSRYVAWLQDEFERAGFQLRPCDVYTTERWLAQTAGLTVNNQPIKIAAYYPRSQETPPQGVTGPLAYGGTAPALSLSGDDLGALQSAIAQYPAQLASWAAALRSTTPQDSILLVDLPMPAPLTAGAFLPIATYENWPGHTTADWASSDYKRLWIEPGLGVPLAPFQQNGAKAVVFIVDASYEALKGGYLPFGHGFEPLPALYVDRTTGEQLRSAAAGQPTARLTLTATRQKTPTAAITAVLEGASKETLIFNTHTDGQGFAEENGGVAFVQLARYFGSLPRNKRLKRTLVFAAWPGHMASDLPQTQGWIDAHTDLVDAAAAALTVEHLGCTEWDDTIDKGYHPTGQPELFGIWTTQGKMFELTRDTVVKHNIPRAALLRPPVQFGVGAAFQTSGVPQIGAIAGPEYLVTISDNGDLDKLDEQLAARQIAWLADLATELDTIPAAELAQGDPTLGQKPTGAPNQTAHQELICGPIPDRQSRARKHR